MNSRLFNLISFSLAVIAILLLPTFAFAQLFDIPQSPSAIVFSINPEYPNPGETVYISIKSFSFDLDRSNIEWFLDGSPYSSGLGMKSIEFVAGEAGKRTSISVSATAPGGEVFKKNTSIFSASVSLLWEAYSYTPPFYKGKKLPSHETLIKVVAMPEFSVSGGYNPERLVYTWSRDGKVLGSLSGVGRQSLIFRMPKLTRTTTVEVLVSTQDNTTESEGKVTFLSRNPEALVYEKHPLLGVIFSDSFSGDARFGESEVKLVGYPYYFSEDSALSSKLKYDWKINRFSVGVDKNEIVFRAPENERGSSGVVFKVENTKEFLQSANSSFGLILGEERNTANPFF